LDKKQIGDRIDPSSRQRAIVDLGAALQIDKPGAKEKLADIKCGDGDLGPCGKENPGSLFQQNIKDLQNPHDQ